MRRARKMIVGISMMIALAPVIFAQEKATTPAQPAPKKSVPSAAKPADEEAQRRQIIFNILEEAHAAATELPTEERIAILKNICGTAFHSARPFRISTIRNAGKGMVTATEMDVDDPRMKKALKNWSEELYSAADELTQGSYAKLDAQAAAVRAMVPVDDKRAMQMLDGLDASDEQGAREQRNFLAMYVFSEVVRKQGATAVPDLRARAQALGETGQYPYMAMATVAGDVEDKEAVRAIFGDALSNFQRSDDKLNSMFGMLSLLRRDDVRSKLQAWQVHEGSVAVANRLKAEIDQERRAYDEGRSMRPGLSLIANSVKAGLKDIDPELAATIPEFPPYKPSPAKQTVGDSSQQGARTDSADLTKARTDFDKTSTRLMEMSEDEVHGGPELRQTIERGIDQAVEVLRRSTQDAKNHVAAMEAAMGPVTDFLQVGARTNPAMALAAVRKVQDSEIRARMLLVLAEGLPDPKYKQ
jgi:hypothetical protein